ncbi:MAG: hypothetical protein M3O82_07005 [Verrucomicrobiota bacterium]|nr:hypothetical protein [Verrucomicrobiota bacterium]
MLAEPPEVPFERVATLIRQLTHDFRNSLNAIDLQTVFLSEIASEAEVKEEIKRLRDIIRNSAKALQQLSSLVQNPKPNLMDCPIEMFVQDFRDRVARNFSGESAAIEWQGEPSKRSVETDIELLNSALTELLKNAFHFRDSKAPFRIHTLVRGTDFVIELHEPKIALVEPADWEKGALRSSRRGAHGLGLVYVDRIIGALGARLSRRFVKDELITEVLVPLATDGS